MNNNTHIDLSIVVVVIVNYGTPGLTCRAVDSLAHERQFLPNLSLVIVDNCSPDDSLDIIENHLNKNTFKPWATVLKAGKNGGFAYGNNLGFSYAITNSPNKPDFFWMLNPDTYLREQAGLNLVTHLKSIGPAIVGSRLEDADGSVQVSTFNFPTWKSEILSGFCLGFLDRWFSSSRVAKEVTLATEKVDWVAGASLMIPAKVFHAVGPMDEDYFLYFEEVDYCFKIQREGFDCWHLPSSRVVHEVGASTGISDLRKAQPRRPQYWFDSRRRYFLKNQGKLRLLLADTGWIAAYSFWLFRKLLTDREDVKRQPPKLLSDFIRNSCLNPKTYW